MFERLLGSTLKETIEILVTPDLNGGFPRLKRLLTEVGRSDAEVADLVVYFTGKGKPNVRHGFPRGKAEIPCYSVLLSNESTQGTYLGNNPGPTPAAIAFVDAVEKELGHPVDAKVKRFALTYSIICYSDNADVTLALYTICRDTFLVAEDDLAEQDVETPDFSGMDLAPDPRYLPPDIYAREFKIQTYGHRLYAKGLDLSPFATGRVTKVGGLYVANNVRGVTPKVSPVPFDEVDGGEDD